MFSAATDAPCDDVAREPRVIVEVDRGALIVCIPGQAPLRLRHDSVAALHAVLGEVLASAPGPRLVWPAPVVQEHVGGRWSPVAPRPARVGAGSR